MRSLRTQLLISHLVLVIFVGVVLGGAAVSFFSLRGSIEQVLTLNYPTVLATQDLEAAIRDQRLGFEMIQRGDTVRGANMVRTNASRASLNIRQIGTLVTEGDERRVYGQLVTLHISVSDRISRLASANELSVQPGLSEALATEVEPKIRDILFHTSQIRLLNEQAVVQGNDRARAAAQNFSFVGLAVTVISLVVGIFLAYRMMNIALRPLALIAHHAESLGSGNLSERLIIPREDEIGKLADSFNEMATRFAEMQSASARRLERAQRMSDAALDSLYDPVIVTDAKTRIIHLNRAAEDVFGPAQTSPRIPLLEHIQDPRLQRALETVIDSESVVAGDDERSLMRIRHDGADHIYRLRVTPMTSDEGQNLGAVAVLEDVTRLNELDRMKTEFIGVAAHELRTPVASLLLNLQLLEEGAVGELTPAQKELVRVQRSDLERLEQLTRDLLDVTRLESGTLAPRKAVVKVSELLGQLERTLTPIAAQKGVAFAVLPLESDVTVEVDTSQILRVLLNLANNAIRHTPEGGSVKVTATLDRDQVSFSVQDTGEGIPAEYLQRIFERFVQVPGATQGGAGLGLSIAQKIVRNHGGEMSVESELGKGSSFRFTVPLIARPREDETA